MKLTLVQWKALEIKATIAHNALAALGDELVELVLAELARRPRDTATLEHLLKVQNYVDTASMAMSSISDHVRPVSEWVGGEKWKWREPDRCYGGLSARRYFTPEEVAELTATLGKRPPTALAVPSIVPPAPPQSSGSQ